MVTTSATFRSWIKASVNMKLISDASVLRVTHEGITSYDTLVDFDKSYITTTLVHDALPISSSVLKALIQERNVALVVTILNNQIN